MLNIKTFLWFQMSEGCEALSFTFLGFFLFELLEVSDYSYASRVVMIIKDDI